MDTTNEQRLPNCLSLKRLSLEGAAPAKGSELVATPGGGASTSYPNFFQEQQHTHWCWAAVSTALGNYYQSQTWSTFTQLQLYCAMFGLTPSQCTGTRYTDSLCNRDYQLIPPMQYVGVFRKGVIGTPSRNALRIELVNDRPFAVHLNPNTGADEGHFVVISAYSPGTSGNSLALWYVCDPWAAGLMRWVVCDTFPERYPGDPNSTWDYTYYTAKGAPNPASRGG
ncbi:Peptidase C39-like domain-containing protein [Bordetella sputigena]|uniref:hypothetical protein n=1 Tax=Bordetella sputigena TaxID=1416810 RepID=UPI0039EFB2AC